ncbi:MAG: CHAT domain-containing protein [Myxococcota bacterium]
MKAPKPKAWRTALLQAIMFGGVLMCVAYLATVWGLARSFSAGMISQLALVLIPLVGLLGKNLGWLPVKKRHVLEWSSRRVFIAVSIIIGLYFMILMWIRNSGQLDSPVLRQDSEATVRSSAPDSTTPDLYVSSVSAVSHVPVVEYGGCMMTLVSIGGDNVECVYEPNKTELKVWVTHSRASEAKIFVDSDAVNPEGDSLEHEPGQGYRFVLHAGVRYVTVTVPGAESWSLRLRDVTTLDPRHDAQREAIVRQARLLQVRLHKHKDERALIELDRLIRYTLSRGLLSLALQIAAGTSYIATNNLEQYAVAQQILDSLATLAERYPEGRAMFSIYRGRVSRLRGRQIDAAMHTRSGSQVAMRLRNSRLQVEGLAEYAMVLANLGYFEAAGHWTNYALELCRKEVPQEISRFLEMVASTNLLLKKNGHPYQDPQSYYEELRTRSSPSDSRTQTLLLAIAHLGLAEIAILKDEPGKALRLLRQVDGQHLPHRWSVMTRDLELQAHLALDSPLHTLESKLRALEEVMPQTLDLEVQWRAAVHRGQTLEALNRPRDALLAYEASERILDVFLPLVTVGVDSQNVAIRYDEGTHRLISLLLQESEPRAKDALCIARRAQARLRRLSVLLNRPDVAMDQPELFQEIDAYLRAKREHEELLRKATILPVDSLRRASRVAQQQRRDFQEIALAVLSRQREHEVRPRCEELRARSPGELLLGLYPVGEDLVVFISDDEGVVHHVLRNRGATVSDWRNTALARSLLGPIEDRIPRASSIRVLAGGEARAIPVHALPFEEDSLLGLERPVVYSFEFPVRMSELSTGPAHALVLGDTQALGAVGVADFVAEALLARDHNVDAFTTNENMGVEIRALLPVSNHFFYAGHAYFRSEHDPADVQRLWPPYPGGAALGPSYLPLDEVAHLEVADVLMLDRVPELAVLMGGATGVDDRRTHIGGQSLASAFVEAGSSVVIASTRTVNSQQAFLLSEGLYRHLLTLDAEGPGRWMQAAMRWVKNDDRWHAESFADYRVFVP